jgi:hypothetical protein
VITLGIVDFCLLVGDRASPDTVAARIEGDERPAAVLLAVVACLAGP